MRRGRAWWHCRCKSCRAPGGGRPTRPGRRLSRPRPTHRTGKPPHRPSNSRPGRPGRFGPRTPR
ncbi:hypothetical protein FIV34_12135 [Luteibacter pinisoli]|uniref:Uncharacterized protein n=1 Tax=Luteibacter pinisoli TaxID=2589080 RepID=A0A4Y5Z414_9GAMM|nr:hypothetical protein FIV34_12135 [Luteibacter pinisoli]